MPNDLDAQVHAHVMGQPWDALLAPPYSTDVAAAWRVVEHLHAQGYDVTIESGRFDPTTDALGYEVTFRRQGDVHASGPSSTGYAATVAEAICRAALEVVS